MFFVFSKPHNIIFVQANLLTGILSPIEHNLMNWVQFGSICSITCKFDVRKWNTKFGVRFGSIAEVNRTQFTDWVRLSSISEHSIDYAGNNHSPPQRPLSLLPAIVSGSWLIEHTGPNLCGKNSHSRLTLPCTQSSETLFIHSKEISFLCCCFDKVQD